MPCFSFHVSWSDQRLCPANLTLPHQTNEFATILPVRYSVSSAHNPWIPTWLYDLLVRLHPVTGHESFAFCCQNLYLWAGQQKNRCAEYDTPRENACK